MHYKPCLRTYIMYFLMQIHASLYAYICVHVTMRMLPFQSIHTYSNFTINVFELHNPCYSSYIFSSINTSILAFPHTLGLEYAKGEKQHMHLHINGWVGGGSKDGDGRGVKGRGGG